MHIFFSTVIALPSIHHQYIKVKIKIAVKAVIFIPARYTCTFMPALAWKSLINNNNALAQKK